MRVSSRHGYARFAAKNLLLRLYFSLLLLLMTSAGSQAAATPPSDKPYNRPIVVGLPYQIINAPLGFWEGEQPEGFSVDYLRDIARRLDLTLQFRPFDTMQQAVDALCQGRIDVVPDLMMNAMRRSCMTFSNPYLRSPLVLVVRRGAPTLNEDELDDHTFVAERGYATAHWLAPRLSSDHLHLYPTTRDALEALQRGEGDAYLGEPYQLNALFETGSFSNLEVRAQDIYDNAALHYGIARNRPGLREALNGAMARTPTETLVELQQRWLDQRSIHQRMEPGRVSTVQRRFLDALPILKVGYESHFRPIAFVDLQGKARGLSYSYLDYLMKMLRLRTEEIPVEVNETSGRTDLDLRLPVEGASERLPGWRYTRPFVKIPNVLVTRLGEPAKTSIEELNGSVLAIPPSPNFAQRLQRRIPDSRLIPTADTKEGFELVRTGKVDGYVGNLVTVDRLLEKGWSDSLKIAATTDVPMELSIAVAERHADLVPLLDQLIQILPIEQRDLFAQQWLRNTYEVGVSPQRLWRIVGGLTFVALLVIGVLLYAQLSLKARERALRQAEQRLNEQLRFSRELLDSYPYPVAVKDRQRRYLMINKAYQRTFGIQSAQVLGRAVDEVDYYPPAVRRRISQMADTALQDGKRQQVEHILPDNDGNERNWLYIVTPYRLDSAKPQGVLTTFIDVTSIRAAERQAGQLQRRLARITQNLPATVFEARLHSALEVQLTYVAGNVETLLGVSPAALLDSSSRLSANVFKEDYPALKAAIRGSFEDRAPCLVSFRLGKPKNFRWIRVEAMPWQDADGSVALAGVLLDVTEAQAYEEMLAKTKHLAEQAAEAKAAFLATMSHEIRTPMNGILGLLELMGDLPLPADAREMLVTAHESTRSLLQVLDDTLDFSRLDSGMLTLIPQPTNLRQLVDGVLRLIGPQAHAKGLIIANRVDHEVAGLLEVDGSRLRQILLNLLSNATKFTEHGSLRLDVSACETSPTEQRIEFLVADTGIGISPEQQHRLFQPFVQADSSITRRYGGSGLGLMISRQLVRLMGGELELNSRLGEGTCLRFSLFLPVVGVLEEPFQDRSVQLDASVGPHREALENHLVALGFTQTDSSPDLFITADTPPADAPPTLIITPVALPIGYAVTPSGTRLSVSPLTWGALQAAIEQVIYGHHRVARSALPRPTFASGQRVLVVEDHPTNRLLLTRQLQHLGCDFALVENGREALERLAVERYALILTDCYMPELDGYAMTRQVRQAPLPMATIPVIGMTASIHPHEHQRARAAGMDELVLKPIGLGALIALFEKYLDDAPGAPPTLAEPPQNAMAGLRAVMWRSFREETLKDLPAFEEALKDGDSATLGELLHKVAGGLRLVDDQELAASAQRLHRDVQEGTVESDVIGAFVTRLRKACDVGH